MWIWILLVILVVVIVGGFIVYWICGFFGFENCLLYFDINLENSKLFNFKYLIYEIFGFFGIVVDISYFDVNFEL